MTRFLIPVLTISILCAAALHADERAEQLRSLHAKFSDKVVVLTWSSTTSGMGQTVETKSATTGLLVGDGGLVMLSAQPLTGGVGGMASAFGGGGSTGPENFKIHTADGKALSAHEALKADALNLRWYGLGSGETAHIKFDPKQAMPALGDEVVIIGAHDEALNYARFFRTARINCIVEDGKYYGLDGSVADCLGAIVVSLDGKVLGVVGQKKGKDEPAAGGGGGFGRILGGLNDPSRAIGNRVLISAAVFQDDLVKAQKAVLAADFGKGGATPTPDREPTPTPAAGDFEGTVANANYRERQQDVFVLIDVKTGTPPAMDDKVSILDAAGKEVAVLTIARRYNSDAMDPNSPIDQVGGFIADPEKKLKIEKGFKVTSYVEKPVPPASNGFRGVERFTKMTEDVLKENFGGIKVGFSVSQIPDKDSQTREAGLRSGDLIYKVNDTEITAEHTLQDFLKLLRDAEGDVKLSIVRRGGEKLEITVKP